MKQRIVFAAFSMFLGLVSHAFATGNIVDIIAPADRVRLDNYDAVRVEALKIARASADQTQKMELEQAIAPESQTWESMDMTGEWRCRTIKTGGLAELIVYGWFRCRVTDDGSGWMLEKLSGSQRTKGRFYDESDKRLTYLGSFAVNEDAFPPYGSGPDTDQVGYAFRMGDDHWRIELPSPRYESKLDILEFMR